MEAVHRWGDRVNGQRSQAQLEVRGRHQDSLDRRLLRPERRAFPSSVRRAFPPFTAFQVFPTLSEETGNISCADAAGSDGEMPQVALCLDQASVFHAAEHLAGGLSRAIGHFRDLVDHKAGTAG
jgi:hypothetical protein